MGYEILMVLGVGILWATVGIILSRVAIRNEDFLSFMTVSSVLLAVSACIIIPHFDALVAHPIADSLRPAPVIVLAGIFSALGMTAMNYSMRLGHHGATWTIGQSALIFPFILGIGIWKDRVNLINICGLLAVLTEIVILGMVGTKNKGPAKSAAWRWLFAALGTMLLLGIQQTLTTIPSRWPDWQDVAHLRAPLLLIGSLIGYAVLKLVGRQPLKIRAWKEALMLSAAILLSQILLFRALDIFAASSRSALVYPVAVGTCTTTFGIYSLAYLKEKATLLHILGIGLGCVGVILVSLK